MKKKVFGIWIMIIIILFLEAREIYGTIGKDINEKITNWYSGGYTGWTEEMKEEQAEKILANLKKDFQYKGNSIDNEMKMKTSVSIEDKYKGGFLWLETKYKIRVRYRNR